MAFKLVGSLGPYGGPLLRSEILANSTKRTELDSVQVSSGFIAAGSAGALVFGHIVAFVQNLGIGLNTDGTSGAAIGSFVNAWTPASDNQTVAKVRAQVDISKESLYSVAPDAAIGTTTGSNLLGYHTDISSATATDENTATTGTAQYMIWGVDPNVAANQIVSIYESQALGV